MLVIRLQRTGRKNKATFRLVIQEKQQAPNSKVTEIVGTYNPHLKERKDQIVLKEDRIKHWLSVGAQPSNTVHNMLVEFGLIDAPKKRVVQPKLKKKEDEEGEGAAEDGEKPAEGDAPAEDKPEEKKEEVKEEKQEEKKEEKKDEPAEEKKDDEKKE